MPRLKVMRRVQLGMLLEPGEIIEVSPDKATKMMRRYRRYFVTVGDEETGKTYGTRDRGLTLEEKGIASARRVGLPGPPEEERPVVENRAAVPEEVTAHPQYRSQQTGQWSKKRAPVRDEER